MEAARFTLGNHVSGMYLGIKTFRCEISAIGDVLKAFVVFDCKTATSIFVFD